jgi:hypothetical protein
VRGRLSGISPNHLTKGLNVKTIIALVISACALTACASLQSSTIAKSCSGHDLSCYDTGTHHSDGDPYAN